MADRCGFASMDGVGFLACDIPRRLHGVSWAIGYRVFFTALDHKNTAEMDVIGAAIIGDAGRK